MEIQDDPFYRYFERMRVECADATEAAKHLFDLHSKQRLDELEAAFGAIERLRVEGDSRSGASLRSATWRTCRVPQGEIPGLPAGSLRSPSSC